MKTFPTFNRCLVCGSTFEKCTCPPEQAQFVPDNPPPEKKKPMCVECGGDHEPSGAGYDCIKYWKTTALAAIDLVEWGRALLCSATPNPKFLHDSQQRHWSEGFGKWFASSHVMPALANELGTAQQIVEWLTDGTFRVIFHRHDDTYRALDESRRLFMDADTLPLLCDALLCWPSDAKQVEACNSYETLRAENERLKAKVEGYHKLACEHVSEVNRLKAQRDELASILNLCEGKLSGAVQDSNGVIERKARATLASVEKENTP